MKHDGITHTHPVGAQLAGRSGWVGQISQDQMAGCGPLTLPDTVHWARAQWAGALETPGLCPYHQGVTCTSHSKGLTHLPVCEELALPFCMSALYM